jgi:AcrR family transcriptional regulator
MDSPAAVLGLRNRQRAETRERLFAAALDEIRRAGVTGAQVDRIVAAAGVARGTFYFHFPAKEDVVLEWERRRQAEIIARLHAPDARRQPLRAALLEIVTFLAGLEAAAEERRLVLDALAIHVLHGADPSKCPLLEEIERRLTAAAGRGEIRSDRDARQLAILFMSNVFGFLVAHADLQLSLPTPELLVDVFLSGVSAPRQSRGVARATGGRGTPRRAKR